MSNSTLGLPAEKPLAAFVQEAFSKILQIEQETGGFFDLTGRTAEFKMYNFQTGAEITVTPTISVNILSPETDGKVQVDIALSALAALPEKTRWILTSYVAGSVDTTTKVMGLGPFHVVNPAAEY